MRGKPISTVFLRKSERIFSTGVEAFTAAAAAALASAYDFGGHRNLLDVAGGTGSFLIAILRRHTDLRGTLFELPGACTVARQRLSESSRRARASQSLRVICWSTIYPDGHDLVLAANIVHGLSEVHNVHLLSKMRARAPAGARLLLVDLWMDPSHTQPPQAPLMSGEFPGALRRGASIWRGGR